MITSPIRYVVPSVGAVMLASGGSLPTVTTTSAVRDANGDVNSVSVSVAVYTPAAA